MTRRRNIIRSVLFAGTRSSPVRPGFTLIEMVVVSAIVLVLLGLVLPAASALWDNRKIAGAENIIQGLLKTTRARALRANGSEGGLFFFVDTDNIQRMVPIELDPENEANIAWQNVFRVVRGRSYSLPEPMRVVPRYVVSEDQPSPSDDAMTFSVAELANDSLDDPESSTEINEAQRHRNYFTMVYSSDGRLIDRRDVLIRDDDLNDDEFGDVTGLRVGPGGAAGAEVTEYYRQDDVKMPIDPTGNEEAIDFVVADPRDDPAEVALNFPSVDGVLVYDDSSLRGLDTGSDRREFLLRSAQPFYVNRFTGAVIRGPIGENVQP